jgi:hypothetical protein
MKVTLFLSLLLLLNMRARSSYRPITFVEGPLSDVPSILLLPFVPLPSNQLKTERQTEQCSVLALLTVAHSLTIRETVERTRFARCTHTPRTKNNVWEGEHSVGFCPLLNCSSRAAVLNLLVFVYPQIKNYH